LWIHYQVWCLRQRSWRLTLGSYNFFLFDKTDVEHEEWVIKMKGDMVPPKFKLNVDPGALRYKCNKMFEVPEGMCDAVLAKMASKCEKRQFEKLEATTNEDWESPMFHQPKEGRIDPSTGAQDCRILCACVYLNDKNKPEDWMKEFSPTLDGFLREFMQRDKYFAKVDDWDAFEIVKVDDASKKYLVFVFKLRGVIYKYRALCMIQGCNTSALFYPVFKHLIFNQILGRCWKIYWSIYQDDTIPKGMSIEEVAGRLRILLMIYKVFDIEVSPKCYDKTGEIPITQQVKAAGYVLSEAGISCGDEFYDVMVVLLTKVIRSIKQLESLIGPLLQAHVAFRFDIDQIAIFGELMAMLQVVLKRAKAGGKIQYNEEIKPVCEELLSFVKILPLVKCLPEELIDDQHCLIYLGDIGDTGKGMLVYRVGIPDAREVIIPDDLQDPNLTQLVRSFHGVLSSDELKWLTVENEANNMVQSLKKTSGMLVSACSGYPANGVQKVGVYSDSSSAVLGVSNLFVPDGKIEFLTAKARKVAHWRDDIPFVRHVPIWFAGIPGHENCLSDFLSHIHDELMARALRQKNEKRNGSVMLVEAVHTAPGIVGRDAVEADDTVKIPFGFKTVKMMLSDDEWVELCGKYRGSKTEILEVSIGVIYRVLVMKDSTVSKVETKRVLGWKNKVFPVNVGDGEVALFVRAPLQDADLIDWEEEGLEQLDNVFPKEQW
jgi:hypothetical protein